MEAGASRGRGEKGDTSGGASIPGSWVGKRANFLTKEGIKQTPHTKGITIKGGKANGAGLTRIQRVCIPWIVDKSGGNK